MGIGGLAEAAGGFPLPPPISAYSGLDCAAVACVWPAQPTWLQPLSDYQPLRRCADCAYKSDCGAVTLSGASSLGRCVDTRLCRLRREWMWRSHEPISSRR